MIDWRKDATGMMFHLNDLDMRKNEYASENAEHDKELLKEYAARYVRMATQKNAGQRGNVGDLDTLNTLEITGMTIIICAVRLCLGGVFGPMPDKIPGDKL